MLQHVPLDVVLICFDQRNPLRVEPSTQTVRSTNKATDAIPREASLLQSAHKARKIWPDWASSQADKQICLRKITFNHPSFITDAAKLADSNIPSCTPPRFRFYQLRASPRMANSEYSGTRNMGKYSVNGILPLSSNDPTLSVILLKWSAWPRIS